MSESKPKSLTCHGRSSAHQTARVSLPAQWYTNRTYGVTRPGLDDILSVEAGGCVDYPGREKATATQAPANQLKAIVDTIYRATDRHVHSSE